MGPGGNEGTTRYFIRQGILRFYNINLKRLMKVEHTLALTCSLRARLRLSRSFIDLHAKGHKHPHNLTRLYKRSSHIKRIIANLATSQKTLKKRNTALTLGAVKTRSKSRRDLDYHPFRHLVSRNVDPKTFKRFLKEAHEGAVYSAKHLETIEISDIIKKGIQIEEMGEKKFLILDLDETLIHTVTDKEGC